MFLDKASSILFCLRITVGLFVFCLRVMYFFFFNALFIPKLKMLGDKLRFLKTVVKNVGSCKSA